ncbi:hypothetical protein U1769_24135 [Sphingomonas sp. ZT3P38]|uniref:hypothetical protein n=1 Tax=Parasphingomonas zepuensis TaxID=3096161 RepID=UPI002FC69678
MPDHAILDCRFAVERVDYLSPEAGGRLGAVSAGFPLWHMSLGLQNMTVEEGDAWMAWKDSLRGSQRRFHAFDVKRLMPRFHAKGMPYTRTPSGWEQEIDGEGNQLITLQGMMTGMVLSRGDWIGFEWDGFKRSLVRVLEGGIADSGQELLVTVEPSVPSMTPADAVANLHKPTCLMRLVTDETELMDEALGGFVPAGGRIGAVQDLVA